MSLYLYSIDEAIDRKFIVTKSMSKQAKPGTLIHIMDTAERSDGKIAISYLVTETGQNFTAMFDSLKQFCKWARPDNFIARHYESLSNKDIMTYLKVTSRSFLTFCLPIIAILLVIVWGATLILAGGTTSLIIAAAASVVLSLAVIYIFKSSKHRITMDIYTKVSSGWGISIK